MAQKTTYSKPIETEADRIAKAERAKEKARIAETERLASLKAVVDAEVLNVAAEIVAERGKNGPPVDTVKLEAQAEARLAQHLEDEALYDAILEERDAALANYYRFAKAATTSVFKFVELSSDIAPVCRRLNKANPIRASVMGVSDGTGVITDPIRHTDEVWQKFIKLYRVESGQIDMDTWERLP